MKISRHFSILLILFLCEPSIAIEPVKSLNEQLVNFLDTESHKLAEKGFRSQYKIGHIDPRLNIKPCETNLQLSLNRDPMEQNNLTVLVRCDSNNPWKLYINASFDIFGDVIIASSNIRRGHLITDSDLEAKEEIINRSRHHSFSSADQIIGMVAKRSIRLGSIIQSSQLKAPKLVKRGDNVTIVATNSAISVRMNGTALSDGSLGQQISIRNNQSERIVKARVSEIGLVTITL